MADDDAMHEHHIETLVRAAQADSLEFAYGKLRQIRADGTERILGAFPPEFANLGLQASIYHAGLRFMELELAHALFGTPNDWGLIRRMWLAGVRIGFVDEVITTYWPSERAVRLAEEPRTGAPPVVDANEQLQAELERLRAEHARVLDARVLRWSAPARRLVRGAVRRVTARKPG
jgi:hypothetical protein